MARFLDPILAQAHHGGHGQPALTLVAWALGAGVLLGSTLPAASVSSPAAGADACITMATAAAALALLAACRTRRPIFWRTSLLMLSFCGGCAIWIADHRGPTRLHDAEVRVAVVEVDGLSHPDPERPGVAAIVVRSGPDRRALRPDHRRAWLYLPQGGEVNVGRHYLGRFRFNHPRPPAVPGAFDPRAWAAQRGLQLTLHPLGALIPLHPAEEASPLAAWRDATSEHRQAAFAMLSRHSPHGILPAIALGQGSSVHPEVRASFARSGLAHVLAVSGLHFGLVAMAVLWLASQLLGRWTWLCRRVGKQRAAACVTLPLLLFYVIYVGAPVSARRAFIMASCLLGAQILRRDPLNTTSLALAAIMLLLYRPAELFSPGFQLSFSAVLGLIWTSRSFEAPWRCALQQRIQRPWLRRPLQWLLSSSVATGGASLATTPALIAHFGEIPLVGIVANLWVIPTVSFVLLPLALLAVLFQPLLPEVGRHLSAAAGWAETWMVASVDLFVSWMPAIHTATPRAGWLIAATTALALFALRRPQRRAKRVLALLLALGLCAGLWLAQACVNPPWRQPPLEVTFLAVGLGDAIFIAFPTGHNMLIDAGGVPGARFDVGERLIVPYLGARGVNKLDWLVLTHPHYDHYGGMEAVLDAIAVDEIWLNGDVPHDAAYQSLAAAISASGAEVKRIDYHHPHLRIGEVSLQVLWPPPDAADLDRNNRSIVLRLDYDRVSFLFTGDIEEPAERALVARGAPLSANVLKAGHHGSSTSSSALFLDTVQPEHLILSLGVPNRFDFPHAGPLWRATQRGISTLRTDIYGSIRFQSNGRSLALATCCRP